MGQQTVGLDRAARISNLAFEPSVLEVRRTVRRDTEGRGRVSADADRVTGNLTIEERARTGRAWIAAWFSGNDRGHRKLLGSAWVKDSGRRTARGAVVWRAKDGTAPDGALTPKAAQDALDSARCAGATSIFCHATLHVRRTRPPQRWPARSSRTAVPQGPVGTADRRRRDSARPRQPPPRAARPADRARGARPADARGRPARSCNDSAMRSGKITRCARAPREKAPVNLPLADLVDPARLPA